MRRSLSLVPVIATTLVACSGWANYVKVDRVALGRVVVYRNGVAYYERRATVEGGVLTVSVPRDRVDDFLKSLTVVDAISRQPLPVSIPRRTDEDGAYLTMKLQLPGRGKADVLLTYVTESPAWKPSYRVVVGANNKVMLEGWAVVDNVSGEDWKNILVGVGSSSALSFRYDLWSVRLIERETLQDEARFAIAPPQGVSPYGGSAGYRGRLLRGDRARAAEGTGGRTSRSPADDRTSCRRHPPFATDGCSRRILPIAHSARSSKQSARGSSAPPTTSAGAR